MEIHKPCTFVLTIRYPLPVMEAVCKLLAEKKVQVESMQLLVLPGGAGRLLY